MASTLQVDTIKNAAGTGAPDFANGLTNSGTRSSVFLNGSNGYGSTATKIRRYTTNTIVGTDITYADSATAGASLTINVAGVYSISVVDNFNVADSIGVSLNSANLTTNVQSLAAGEQIAWMSTAAANYGGTVSVTLKLNVNDVIRPHSGGSVFGSVTNACYFRITRVL